MGLFGGRARAQAQSAEYRAWADEPVLRGRASVVKPDGADWVVILLVVGLLSLGALMVYSASISLADSPKYNTTPYHFLVRHLLFIAMSLAMGCVVYRIPMRVWNKLAPFLVALAIVLLCLVLVPGVGKSVNGSRIGRASCRERV